MKMPVRLFLFSGLFACASLTGQTNRAADYDGTDGVRYAYREGFNRNVAMTIEAWVYRDDSNNCETILSQDFLDSYWFGFCNRLRFYRSGGSAVTSTEEVPAGQWTHVAVSYDGTTARFYMDGFPAGAFPLSNNGASSEEDVFLGSDPLGYRFSGRMDEVRLWSVVRTRSEIRNGRFRELRNEPGLEAVWDDGGLRELISGSEGTAFNSLPAEAIEGVLPSDLSVPQSATVPSVDGSINLNSEYLNAERMVLRYFNFGQSSVADANVYLVHDTLRGLYLGITGGHPPAGQFPGSSLFVIHLSATDDTGLPSGNDVRITISVASETFQVERGTGLFDEPWFPDDNLRSSISVAFGSGSEFTLKNIEVRLRSALLGGTGFENGIDRLGILHTQIGSGPGSTRSPGRLSGTDVGTWARMSYGSNPLTLPRIRADGEIRDPLNNQPVPGALVRLVSGSQILWAVTSDIDGEYSFSKPIPPDEPFRIEVRPLVNAVFRESEVILQNPSQLDATSSSPGAVFFPGRPLGAPEIDTAYVRFNMIPERGPVDFGAVTPDEAWPRTQVRGGSSPRFVPAGRVELEVDPADYHDQIDFYLVETYCANDPRLGCTEAADYFPIPEVSELRTDESGRSFIELTIPQIPTARMGELRVVGHDTWSRPSNNPDTVGSWRYATNPLVVGPPPYPFLYGFSFENRADGINWEEFTAVYEMNAFADPLFCVPWPHYLIWFPVYAALAGNGGSCVGMAVTSQRLFAGDYDLARWDRDAIYPSGHRVGSDGATEPPRPSQWGFEIPCRFMPDNLWGEIVRNHGKQLSDEMLGSIIPQLLGAGSGPDRTLSIDGEPTAVFNRLAGDPTNFILCMTPQVGSGHCVTPYRVEFGRRLARPTSAGRPAVGTFVDDPNFNLIHIYENNDPNAVRWIDIDVVNDQYWYQEDESGSWNDQGTTDPADDVPRFSGRAIHATPYSLFRGAKTMPSPRLDRYLHLIIFGDATGLFRSDGDRWGFDGPDTFHDEIDGARAVEVWAEVDNAKQNQLFLPETRQLQEVLVDVSGVDGYGFYAAHRGALFRLMLDDTYVDSRDQILPAQDASGRLDGFAYVPENLVNGAEVVVGINPSDTESVSYEIDIPVASPGHRYEARALRDSYGFAFTYESPDSSDPILVDIEMRSADSKVQAFNSRSLRNLSVPSGGTMTVEVPHWPATDRILRTVDVDSDGTPEVSVILSQGTPQLRINWDQICMTLSYDATFAGWQVEQSNSLDGPWIPLSKENLIRTATEYQIRVDHRPALRFYRMALP